jgi:hypothetical protein
MAFPGGAQIAVIRHGSNVPLPVMQLDFLNNTSLNSRITFSRGTNATLVDRTGRITYAPNNLLLRSTMDGAAVGTPGTAPTGWNIALVGIAAGISAVSLDASGNTQIQFSSTAERVYLANSTGVAVAANSTYDFCVTVVATDGVAQIFQIMSVTSPPAGSVETYYADGVLVASTYVPIAGQRLTRRLVTAATTGTISLRIGLGVTGNASGVVTLSKPQLEQVTYQTTPGTYNATTASAYYGPRFDYDPVTLAPRGLLIEEARTNLLTYSEQFDNAAWTKVTVTATANTTTSPDGTVDADSLTASGGSAQHFINQSHSFISGTTYTISVFAKKNTLNGVQLTFGSGAFGTLPYANFDLNAGTSFTSNCTATLTNFGNGWYRCTMTATANATTSAGAVIGLARDTTEARLATFSSDGNGIFIYGAQLEAGAFATSYIPTVASTVSRSADVAFMSGTNFSSWFNAAQGTFVSSVSSNANASCVLVVSDNTVSNQLFMISTADNILSVYTGGAFQAMLGVTPAAPYVNAGAYATNDFAACSNGGTLSTDTSGSLAGSYARMSIGSNFSGTGVFLNGRIRAIAYYNTRLPNTQLQTLTAPSLASPLALDFISPTYTVGY